jgi:hypothetical protein
MLEWLHPMRTSRYLYSETFAPWMREVTALAAIVGRKRDPIGSAEAMRAFETEALSRIGEAIVAGRKLRDGLGERIFERAYGATLAEPRPEGAPRVQARPTERSEALGAPVRVRDPERATVTSS